MNSKEIQRDWLRQFLCYAIERCLSEKEAVIAEELLIQLNLNQWLTEKNEEENEEENEK